MTHSDVGSPKLFHVPEKSKKKENFIFAQHFIPIQSAGGRGIKKNLQVHRVQSYSGHILQHQPKL
jgi:hypothetical protein